MSICTVELSGTPGEMGRQFGEALREAARAMVGTRLELAAQAAAALQPARDWEWVMALAAEAVPALAQYAPPVYQELQGIAEATGLTLPELVIGNGWTDFKDLIDARGGSHNCTSFVIESTLSANGHTCLAQTWDMNVTAAPYLVLVRRRPDDGPATLSLTTAGCLSLIGLNEAGIAIGNTNLTPTDARPGIFYLALIHEALRQTSLAAALEAVTGAVRMSGHYYYLGDAADCFVGLETTATAHAEVRATAGRYVHANHYTSEALIASGLTTAAGANTLGRHARCAELVGRLNGKVSVTDMSQMLADHGGEEHLCRHEKAGSPYATLAAAVLCPAERRLWIWPGNPCQAAAEEYRV